MSTYVQKETAGQLSQENPLDRCNLLDIPRKIDAVTSNIRTTKIGNLGFQLVYTYLCLQMKTFSKGQYAILSGDNAMIAYLLANWNLQDNMEENIEILHGLSILTNARFVPPTGNNLTEDRLVEMLQIADRHFDLFNRLPSDEPMYILRIDNSCRRYNAMFMCNCTNEATIKNLIIHSYVQHEETPPEFSFLHEIGHWVHTMITKKAFVAPRSFDYFHEMIWECYRVPEHERKQLSKRFYAERFADFFAIATIHSSKMSHLNIFSDIMTDAQRKDTIHYMNVLLSTFDINPTGNRTWKVLERIYDSRLEKCKSSS